MICEQQAILALNIGSTSTKLAVFEGAKEITRSNIVHDVCDLADFPNMASQLSYRRQAMIKSLRGQDLPLSKFRAVIARGGVLAPLPGGAYRVNSKMIDDLISCRYGQHPSNLGASLAQELAAASNALALIIDAPTTDEFEPLARLSGLPNIPRKSSFHVLNQRAVGKRLAQDLEKNYEDLNLIGVHLGGGISVAAHNQGKLIDANNALDGDGPYSPQRAGTLPADALINLCFSGKFGRDELYRLITSKSGLMAYLGTQDARDVETRIAAGDHDARVAYEGMAYQVAKYVGAMATVLKGNIDAIFFTGGIAYSTLFTSWLTERVNFLAPVYVYPGEDELRALAEGALAVLNGRLPLLEYS